MVSVSKGTNLIAGKSINNFLGQKNIKQTNIFNMPEGQLLYNKNMEYTRQSNNVTLKTRRGSNLVVDMNGPVIDAGLYSYNLSEDYLVWLSYDFVLRYYDVNSQLIVDIESNINDAHSFIMYGLGTLSSLYIGNETVGIFKLSGAIPTYSIVDSNPSSSLAFSTLSGRMFSVYKHIVRWSNVQVSDISLTNLETYEELSFAVVSPDNGRGFNKAIDYGDAVFFFKDTGVWALINPSYDPENYIFPQMDCEVGTLSPRTVKLVRLNDRAGVMYLGSDKTLRFFSANIIQNAGSLPTLDGGDATPVSGPFQYLLDKINDGDLSKCVAEYYDNTYILTFPRDNASILNQTLVIRTDLLYKGELTFWYYTTNMVCNAYVRKDNDIYGFNVNGYISELFKDNVYVDNVPARIDSSEELAIEWQIYTGWIKISNSQVANERGYLNYFTEGLFDFNFSVNAFTLGEKIPSYESGLSVLVKTNIEEGVGYWDIGLWDEMLWGEESSGQSGRYSLTNKGNYFSYGIGSINKGEWAEIYSIEPIYKVKRNSPIGKR